MASRRVAGHLLALTGFTALAVLYTWPLALDFSSRALGPVISDSSFWEWWLWHFRGSLSGGNPFWSDLIYHPYGANLLLQHGWAYAVEGLLLPEGLSLTAAFNTLMLSNFALAGYGVFLLALECGASWGVAFVAGTAYAFAPDATHFMNIGIGFDHLSRQPIPFFVWALTRAARTGSLLHAVLAAVFLTWLWGCDYYFFLVAALLVPLFFVVLRRPAELRIERRPPSPAWTAAARLLESALAADVVWLALSLRHGQIEFRGRGSARELIAYVAPYAAFWGLSGLRFLCAFTPRLKLRREAFAWVSISPFVAVCAAYAALNAPVILAVGSILAGGEAGGTAHSWRGGGNPTDVAWWLKPSVFHPLWGSLVQRVLGPDLPVSCLGYVPLLGALWLWRHRPKDELTRLWFAGFAWSLLIASGPWLKIFGFHTYLPLPFYFMHLLPVYDNIQTGFVLEVFVMLFLALLFAAALTRLKVPAWAAFAAVVLEFAHSGAPTHAVETPALYERLGRMPPGAVLPVPLGACFDGSSAAGFIGILAHQQRYQTAHGKPIVGGLNGRMPRRVFEQMKADPMVQALTAAQAGAPVPPLLKDRGFVSRYLDGLRLRYILVYTARIPAALQETIGSWPVTLVDDDPAAGLRLYRFDGREAASGKMVSSRRP